MTTCLAFQQAPPANASNHDHPSPPADQLPERAALYQCTGLLERLAAGQTSCQAFVALTPQELAASPADTCARHSGALCDPVRGCGQRCRLV